MQNDSYNLELEIGVGLVRLVGLVHEATLLERIRMMREQLEAEGRGSIPPNGPNPSTAAPTRCPLRQPMHHRSRASRCWRIRPPSPASPLR